MGEGPIGRVFYDVLKDKALEEAASQLLEPAFETVGETVATLPSQMRNVLLLDTMSKGGIRYSDPRKAERVRSTVEHYEWQEQTGQDPTMTA
jgi:hypothetical protein